MKDKCLFLYILLFLFSLSVSFSTAQQRESKPVTFRKISSDLYEIIGGRGARGGVCIGDDSVLIIDAKMDKESIDQVFDKMKQITEKPIKYLVNTHSDGDHIRGNQFFPETVTFIAHENCRKDLFHPNRDGTPSEWNKPELASFIPSITFRDKMEIYMGTKKVEIYYFGIGHTTGDAVVYFPEEKTAFIGDQIFLTRPQLIHAHKGGNSFEHVKNLTKMLETLDAEMFCSGHSEMTDRQGIRNHIDQMNKRQEKVKALINKRKSIEEIKSEFEDNESGLVETIFNEINKALK